MKLKFILLLILAFYISACSHSGKMKQGNELVSKIEKFKSEKGRLPESLSEIGIVETESGPIYYKKESDSKYIVWFGTSLGESMTYDSDTKQWR